MSAALGTRPNLNIIGGIAIAAVVLGVVVFRSPARPTTTEWTPADHDQADAPADPQRAPKQVAAKPPSEEDTMKLIDLAWNKTCASCHGPEGRGDGPQGALLRASDLTRADWQARVSDEDIKNVVRTGRNSMPKFDLPPAVLDGLVRRIRAKRAR